MKFLKRVPRYFLPLALLVGLSTPAWATKVTVFDNDTYVDTSSAPFAAESDNIQASITALGHTVTTFTGITDVDFSTALTGQDVLEIPELEHGDLAPALSPAAITVIHDFVANGGRLIINSSDGNFFAQNVLNTVFGFSVVETDDGTFATNKTPAAAGTIFQNGPATLNDNNGTAGMTLASLPGGAQSIYDDGTSTIVAIIPVGSGEIVFLGWDWFDSKPPDAASGQDNGWQIVLAEALADADLAITKTASAASVVVGDSITYTLTVTNNGPSDALDAAVLDNLPGGVTLVSTTPSQGSCSGTAPIACDLGPLANGVSATIQIVVTATAAGGIDNQASVAGLMIDPDKTNNDADAPVTVTSTPVTPTFPNIQGSGCSLAADAAGFDWVSLGGFAALAAWGVSRRLRSRK